MNQKTESEKRGAAYYVEVLQIVRIKVNWIKDNSNPIKIKGLTGVKKTMECIGFMK